MVLANHKVTKEQRAVKVISKENTAKNPCIQCEIDVQIGLEHPNIAKLNETFESDANHYLVMELCTGGELFDRIVEMTDPHGMCFEEGKVSDYMQQITSAMAYLHGKFIVHRDIKPENLLLQDGRPDASIKIVDFGLSRKFEHGVPMKTKAGTLEYMAPEVFRGSYSEKCDVWSCGVVAYMLLSGQRPFESDTDSGIVREVLKGNVVMDRLWDGISMDGKEFIRSMFAMDAEKRPSFEDLLPHSWLMQHSMKYG